MSLTAIIQSTTASCPSLSMRPPHPPAPSCSHGSVTATLLPVKCPSLSDVNQLHILAFHFQVSQRGSDWPAYHCK